MSCIAAIDHDVQALPQTYSHFRPIQGDGNCGWRGELKMLSTYRIALRPSQPVRSDNDESVGGPKKDMIDMPRHNPSTYFSLPTPQFLLSVIIPP